MREANVLYKKEIVGILMQLDTGTFIFKYSDQWFNDSNKPGISLTLPKTQQEYCSDYLFSFFYNMLPEGSNKQTVCYENRIDTEDHFGILITTAKQDTIGAVTIEKIK
ncbi:HipA N-terminal domain-containing protein [Tenacibaculum finnmarkense genomovar finnmarkense]|uniref:Phosphatidylinositol kinase n=1 Tax=Tenacibaculum finnmarkense genomovar finnmarkense TaxID=1458503 RepID=A0AAP1RGW9_9FLAO|nr:HipA N-terminal domain-containing protein [Tenacibaculum finnmarkense]MBE7653815.1 phosphatidylinositol kinase [Tenacibaculum finnmarkense genomovar finnmarkense]MBE7661064.1 phosphatidylinositol kinase [Tenacibaculum finnmarkense genomovar finnmarkense]MBE7696119.1 phosphatidylinositol kinase [Tenacibaculum finnmarkense genomovar finnmarkense]MCD8418368.1 HipA N-terminal domain-containing protein [Tenacibaculum finnmarkense genomovar finnmarkense]MCD8428353.1 HipA N-terminal domain-contain